jgi:hypothetical protein
MGAIPLFPGRVREGDGQNESGERKRDCYPNETQALTSCGHRAGVPSPFPGRVREGVGQNGKESEGEIATQTKLNISRAVARAGVPSPFPGRVREGVGQNGKNIDNEYKRKRE